MTLRYMATDNHSYRFKYDLCAPVDARFTNLSTPRTPRWAAILGGCRLLAAQDCYEGDKSSCKSQSFQPQSVLTDATTYKLNRHIANSAIKLTQSSKTPTVNAESEIRATRSAREYLL